MSVDVDTVRREAMALPSVTAPRSPAICCSAWETTTWPIEADDAGTATPPPTGRLPSTGASRAVQLTLIAGLAIAGPPGGDD